MDHDEQLTVEYSNSRVERFRGGEVRSECEWERSLPKGEVVIFKIHPELTAIGVELIGHDDDHVKPHQTATLHLTYTHVLNRFLAIKKQYK